MAGNSLNASAFLRTFLAVPLAHAFSREITHVLQALKPKTDAVKWVRPEQVHLTLHFFGSIPQNDVTNIRNLLTPITAQTPALALRIDGLGFFPAPERPKVIWLGLAGDLTRLATLRQEIESALAGGGFPCESREFKPHVTIGRVREGGSIRMSLREMNPDITTGLEPFDRLILYQSHLTPDGPRYEPLETFLLSQK